MDIGQYTPTEELLESMKCPACGKKLYMDDEYLTCDDCGWHRDTELDT
jgi:predicted RNA-binding Zn-ribbon protein involved in translation (DUF1610 family)